MSRQHERLTQLAKVAREARLTDALESNDRVLARLLVDVSADAAVHAEVLGALERLAGAAGLLAGLLDWNAVDVGLRVVAGLGQGRAQGRIAVAALDRVVH